MTSIALRASGYTWTCPECGRENYTGAAPATVRCTGCNGQFDVKELQHRRVETNSRKNRGKEVSKTEMMPLFAAAPPVLKEDDIAF